MATKATKSSDFLIGMRLQAEEAFGSINIVLWTIALWIVALSCIALHIGYTGGQMSLGLPHDAAWYRPDLIYMLWGTLVAFCYFTNSGRRRELRTDAICCVLGIVVPFATFNAGWIAAIYIHLRSDLMTGLIGGFIVLLIVAAAVAAGAGYWLAKHNTRH